MAELMERVNNGIKEAMKAGQKDRLNALRFLKAKFIENNTSSKVIPELDVVVAHYKKMKDSLSEFPEGNAIRAQTERELAFLQEFMPAQMSEEEVKKIILGIKASLGTPNMGAVMKELTPQIKGRFDGKRANDLVKELLA
jgi:uncharacterized protein YqeY